MVCVFDGGFMLSLIQLCHAFKKLMNSSKKKNSKTLFPLASTFFCLAIVTDEKKNWKTKI
jgi:hypothetical protein